ncbi:MAG: ABC transporter permease [Oscillospiraceae bacterium]|jgi:D-methionine transport system permease protein|nr:ABC transporter permease [Oscillospiraceae bacterium]
MLEFFNSPKVAEQMNYLIQHVPFAIWETVYTTVVASVCAYLIGLPLGVLLVVGAKDGIRPISQPLMQGINAVINLLRSMPFLILMVLVMPLSRLIMGTSIGTVGVLVPLSVAAAPFVARLVESSLREMDRGVLEAAQAMGCTTFQIVWKVLLPESLPSLLSGFTTAFVTILGYGAMSGFIGGGGLGPMALQYAWNNQKMVVLYGAVIVLVILVQIFQSIGTRATVRMDRRAAAGQKQKKR